MLRKFTIVLITLFLSYQFQTTACTIIAVGKKASADGSVIVSQTDNGDDCRIRIVPAMNFPKDSKAPVYWGIQRIDQPLEQYGEIIGYIPQVEHTYQYFHSAYSHMNEHQLAIGESTTSMRDELRIKREESKQIMTIEQAMIFALQRHTKARDAVKFIGELMNTYGFLPSCVDESESIVIADPDEAWVFEVLAVGPGWEPASGKPGAIWAAQRIPDDHALVIPNWLIIKEINIDDTENFMASPNYKSFAIEKGWYNPNGTKPFIWQEIYAPTAREWATDRFWLFYSMYAPNYANWPKRELKSPFDGLNDYIQYVEPLSMYPFSVVPEKKISVKDVIEFQRSVFTGTIYDMSEDPDWYIPGKDGTMYKSPLATPFPTTEMRKLLDINHRRNVSRGGYGMVAQLRNWLPDEIGGIYWVYQDNQHVGMYFPLYAGITEVNPKLNNYDPKTFNENSVKWAIDFVDNLLYLKWQDAYKDLLEARNPLEEKIFNEIIETDKKAQELYKTNPKKAKELLTKLSWNSTDEIHKLYSDFKYQLLIKYTNNKQGINFQ
ncbi:MAG: peptidase [Bacteroidetes bacterium GWC2_33_15]|nr:MAG: peptidase [Bacteroidetes bacterium GWA2_33_15]OFX51819.1 MAG: peptidase [Bacteroidetes bacterium GWC2_33_15]OFX66809.1 MAG: peptidase [Bacteroidetes bacterium GWB2_32_14]OFX67067.1 MAG: peptidase [Bacteroidetes bacterium GWD2_33_33]HAN17157.1 peptidase [Bacteroidales bacterium]